MQAQSRRDDERGGLSSYAVVPSLDIDWGDAGVLAAAEVAEPGQRCEERDQSGQRQESLHLHSLHLL
jgi:hypothetical protein